MQPAPSNEISTSPNHRKRGAPKTRDKETNFPATGGLKSSSSLAVLQTRVNNRTIVCILPLCPTTKRVSRFFLSFHFTYERVLNHDSMRLQASTWRRSSARSFRNPVCWSLSASWLVSYCSRRAVSTCRLSPPTRSSSTCCLPLFWMLDTSCRTDCSSTIWERYFCSPSLGLYLTRCR